MKILFLNLYSGQVERGAETFTHELARRLQNHHQVAFLKGNSTHQPTSQFSGTLIHKLLKRCFLDKPGREVLLFTLTQTSNLLLSNYDIVIPLNGFWQLFILKLLQPFKGYRLIVTGHSGPGWDERWNLYLKPDTFVATTGPTLTWAQKTCPYTRSVLIPYAIDPKKFTSKPIKIKLPKPIILCPAALVPYKRIDLAIKAISHLNQGSLLVLGKGPLHSSLKKLGRQLLPGRFLLTSVPYSQIPAYYQAASIVTLPTDPQENSPMVFLEALAAGKMVVTTDTPRNRWLLKTSGIYTDPTDTQQYSQALNKALSTKPSTTKALTKFTWDSVLKQYEQVFNSHQRLPNS